MKGRKTGGRAKGVPNKATREIKALAQKYTDEALNALVQIMQSSESDSARVAAARELLDRAYGKAAQAVTGEGGSGPVQLAVTWLPPK